MKTQSLIVLASALALSAGLAACGDKTAAPGEQNAAAKGDTPASNLSFDASGMPLFKAGLWESRTVEGGEEGEGVTRTCVGPELDAETRQQLFDDQPGCTKSIERANGGLRVKAVCEQSVVKTEMTVVMTGNQTQRTVALDVKVDDTSDPEPASVDRMVAEAKYVGACPAGMQPGDEMDSGE